MSSPLKASHRALSNGSAEKVYIRCSGRWAGTMEFIENYSVDGSCRGRKARCSYGAPAVHVLGGWF